ncbi:MAG: hypothetical protein MR418_06400, partial [Clostridiales bacterium]|nr:hypothetical protein [Clostridiales bacterium]
MAIADAIWLYSTLIVARANHKLELAREAAIHMRWTKFVALPACIRHKSERVRDGAIADAIWLYSTLIVARANHKLELAREAAIHIRWAKFVALPACIRHKSERV